MSQDIEHGSRDSAEPGDIQDRCLKTSEVARTYGVARSWIYTLLARYQADGEAALSRGRRGRSRHRPRSAQAPWS